MFLLHISGNPLSPALETLHKSKFVGVRMGLFATCLNHLLQPFKFSPAPHAPLIIISILQLFEMLSAGANAFSWHNFMRFNNASHHRCPLTQTYTCLARSGEFVVYKGYASHLRRQKIGNICLKFSQPAKIPCIFSPSKQIETPLSWIPESVPCTYSVPLFQGNCGRGPRKY